MHPDYPGTWGVLPDVLDRACTYYADQVAIVEGWGDERSLTYREMNQLRNRIANGLLAIGLQKGDRVGLLMPNCLEFIPIQHAIWAAGAVLVQMPTRAAADGFRSNLAQTDATTLIYHTKFETDVAAIRDQLPKLRTLIRVGDTDGHLVTAEDFTELVAAQADTRPAVAIDEHDVAYVLFTSGSTGEPKGVVNSHFTWSHYSISAGLEIGDIRFGEVFAHGAPLTHFSQIFVMPTFVRGGTNVMLPGLDVEGLLSSIERHHVTATAVVPTIIYLLLDHPRRNDFDLSSLQTMVYAGAPIAPERLSEALAVLGPIFIQTYAGTEPGYISCLRKHEHLVDRLATAGRPMFAVKVSIQDDEDRPLPVGQTGEICSRQIGQMLSYLDPRRNSETLRGGWVHTGDIGFLDADGFLSIVDRKKDLVVSGGFNVFPRQVEDVLATHPAVAHTAVIGVPHEKWGEAVLAVVVTRSDERVSERELIDHVKAALGSVAAPKSVVFTDALPLNPAGKVDKKAIREPYWRDRARQVG
ncbi:AMP-binding protein [Mycolicibacterium sp.]|uniref:AMP-binding protein n=1 Tax=Mycolicibacterium sp. TaxID=2320850 RepID=UPI001A3043CE|nr:AMP-binding protein [Mycolicibacterium sp.]MBJ7337568.1 AMP-binding protein [Mycolicibacterium sp.]